MKKFISIIAVLAIVSGSLCACGKKNGSSVSEADFPEEIITGENPQPDPLAPENTTSAPEKNTSAEKTSTEKSSSTTETTTENSTEPTTENPDAEPDPLGIGIYSINDDGAVVFEKPEKQDDDRVVMAAAEKLFNSACRTSWDMTVGCPYSLDMTDTAENNLGWTFYRVTDERIHSLDDVLSDYYKVFSRKYPADDLDMLFIEANGGVYALNGARGMDMYYSVSKIKSIDSRSDDEIFFTVENFYIDSDRGGGEYSETAVFSAVIESDGTWKAGEFTLPY